MVDINGVEYSEHYCYMEVGYEQSILNCTVYVDDSDTINHFDISCDSNWVEIRRIRNEITLIITKNCAIDDRVATLQFTHNVDSDKYVTISIKQAASEYPIEIDQEIVEFNDLLDSSDNNEEHVDITVTTQNGICDFGIGPVVEYAKNISDGDNTVPYVVMNDKGLKLTKIGKNILRITNYGKVSLYDYNHYIITLYHRNNPRSNVKLKVIYNNSTENNQSGFSFGD